MKSIIRNSFLSLVGLLLLQALNSHAIPVTVKELGVSPAQIVSISVPNFYTGGVYAGIVKLSVDGVAMDGFCIDPFHFSSSAPMVYNTVSLESAPKPPGIMGTDGADLIRKMWALAYAPSMTASAAAGLQIAIWKIVGGTSFTLTSPNDYGAADLIAKAKSYNGPGANLIALTGAGQDYVVQSVPETGSTLILLGLGVLGIGTIRKKILVS